jgi:SAM-dependent methyltransferase
MKWTTKARIQRLLSAIPAGRAAYYLGQRTVGGLRNFNIDAKITQGLSLLESLFAIGEDVVGRRTVEIGTGWAPVVPLLFWAYGQEQCDTFDVTPLLKRRLVMKTLEQMAKGPAKVSAAAVDSSRRGEVEERIDRLHQDLVRGDGSNRILDSCRIYYHGESDAAQTGLPDKSVDLVFSNTVLEHVRLPEVVRLFEESSRILRRDGCMVHLIDTGDHFSHADPSISAINFLQFSEHEFAKYHSAFMYQNRLRASEWRALIQDHRFEIVRWRASVDAQSLRSLPSFPTPASLSHLTPEDLCTTRIVVVAKRTA